MARCPICGGAEDKPYRRLDLVHGGVFEGCVDRYHNKHADAWHNRPDAKSIREGL